MHVFFYTSFIFPHLMHFTLCPMSHITYHYPTALVFNTSACSYPLFTDKGIVAQMSRKISFIVG